MHPKPFCLHKKVLNFLEEDVTQDFIKTLEEANRLIFVRSYEEADHILSPLFDSNMGEDKNDLLVQLRYLELAVKVDTIDKMVEKIESKQKEHHFYELLLIISRQFADSIDDDSAILELNQYIAKYGVHELAYFGLGFSYENKTELDKALFNYNESIKVNPKWYPSLFGMSQIHYKLGQEEAGDEYFYMFENFAPCNVYGNFQTHKKVAQSYVDQSHFEKAKIAIESLSEWWVKNKGYCPDEIYIFEQLFLAQICDHDDDEEQSSQHKEAAYQRAVRLLSKNNIKEKVCLFVAKEFDQMNETDMAVQFYKKLLSNPETNPDFVNKICAQLLESDRIDEAYDIYTEAYSANPDSQDVQFCLLIIRLKKKNQNIPEYIQGKERLKKLVENEYLIQE